MSIQSPVGTLDIKNATLRVGKLEVSNIQGVDTALNVTRANSVLIYDDQASTTTFTGFTSTPGVRDTVNGYLDVADGYVYWGQKLPNAWVMDFEMDIRSGTNPGPLYANVFSTTNTGGDGYSFAFNDNNDKISLYYDGTLLTEATVTGLFTATENWQKVVINYERGMIAISLSGSRKFYYKDIERETPYVNGEYTNFSSASTDGRKIRNLRIVNGEKWMYTGESNIAYTQGSVGIGVSDPQYTLDVGGDINLSGSFYQGGSPFVSSLWTDGGDSLYYRSNVEVGTGNLYVDTTTSRVGINTTTPGYDLDVNGDINFTGTFYQGGSPFVSSLWTSGNDSLYYTASNVGIGTDTAEYTLDVHGNANVGALTTTSVSGDGSALYGIQSSNVSDFASNVTRIETLETDLSDNSSIIGTLETDLSDNSSRIGTLETDLSDNSSRIGTLETDLSDNSSRIGTLETDLSDNSSRIGTLETDLSDNSSRIGTLETDLSDNSSRITSIESGAHTFTGIKTFEDDVILESNLRVNGDLLVANTVHMIVSDPIMELGANNLNTGDLGIIMTRHGETGNVAIVYDESQDVLNVGYTLSNAYENTITMDTANSLTLQVNGALNVGSNIVMDDTASNVIEVSGNVKTDSLFLGNFEVVASQGLSHVTAVSAATNDTVYLNNPTTGLVVDSNAEVGGNLSVEGDLEFNGNLTMNTITVQTLFTLDHVVSQGNTTANTVQFQNATTALTATGNVEVGGELSVSGNVEVGTANLFVDTTTSNVGIRTNNPQATLHVGGTDGIIIPSGTTAQQPTGQTGMVRYNTTKKSLEFYNGTDWVVIGGVSASGGTETNSGQYNIHTFTTSGNFVVYSGGVVEYLLVGGGGGGGRSAGTGNYMGGGGGGGFVSGTIIVDPGTYSIVVGEGGTGDSGSGATNGTNTTALNLTAYGGGHGASAYNGINAGNPGGSGGGGGGGSTDDTGGPPGYEIGGQGSKGGKGGNYSTNTGYKGGGGGGAGGVGQSGYEYGSQVYGLNGGNGKQSDISGTLTYYAGGGGGGVIYDGWSYEMAGGTGGLGGGGNAGNAYTNQTTTPGADGTDGLGGGGGAAGYTDYGGDGGKGIVIIRYLS